MTPAVWPRSWELPGPGPCGGPSPGHGQAQGPVAGPETAPKAGVHPPVSPRHVDTPSLAAGSPREGRGGGIQAATRPEIAAVMGGGMQILLF